MVGAQASQIQFGKQLPDQQGFKMFAGYKVTRGDHDPFPFPLIQCYEQGEDLLIVKVKG